MTRLESRPLVLEMSGVAARYGKRVVLEAVTLHVPRGEWFCLLGPNGVGKSTLLHCIGGRMTPSAGEIRVCGRSVLADPLVARRTLGFACAPDELPTLLTGRQCLEVYAAAKNLAAIDPEVLDLAGQLRFTRYLDQFVDTYSLGTRQKLCVLLALLGDPGLVVFDEAFNGLDPASALALKQHLATRLAADRCGVLLATHSLDIVEHYADRAALLIDGRMAREWDEAQIKAMREHGSDTFEAELAAASDEVTK
jgi:ABC-2 type transport system ATP-binding protein